VKTAKAKMFMIVMTTALSLGSVATPALASSGSQKDVCKGVQLTLTATTVDGRQVTETVYLDWQKVAGSEDGVQTFKNRGDCISHVARGGQTFASCTLLKDSDIRLSVGCIEIAAGASKQFQAWLALET